MTKEIFNFYRYSNDLAAGGQPTEDQIKAIKDEGYDAIINLSPVSTRNYLPTETSLAEELSMEFIHYPVDCSRLKPEYFNIFSSILNELKDKKVFVHCGGNIKSSNLIHMYNVIEKGINEEESLQELKSIQQPEKKWFEYFKDMGMQGLS